MDSPLLPGSADLGDSQTTALRLATDAEVPCLFVTGGAGTGKSTLLRQLVATHKTSSIVLAPTGIAALNVEGQTIHSFLRIKPGPLPAKSVHIFPRESTKRRLLQSVQFIIIDEISMVRCDLFDAIDHSLRRNCQSDRPFGGKGLILFGDLWQLEPVVRQGLEMELLSQQYESPFFFDSHVFRETSLQVAELTTIYRQSEDQEFADALSSLRRGQPSGLDLINSKAGMEPTDAEAVTLATTNMRAMSLNLTQLSELSGDQRTYVGQTTGDFGQETPTDRALVLKVGAQVMFLRNSEEWVNGSIGTVIELQEKQVLVELSTGGTVQVKPWTWEKISYSLRSGKVVSDVVGSFTQLPLKLAWAITIHKSQGLTFDRVHIDLDRPAFAHGQMYVALSRCRTLSGLTLSRKLTPGDLRTSAYVRQFEWEQGIGD